MSVLVSAHQIRKSFASRPLFEGLTFSISDGERIGLIGPNGAGKSTLLRLIAGRDTPDQGDLARRKGLRIGFLEQVPSLREKDSVLSNVLDGLGLDPPPPAEEVPWEVSGRAYELISRLELDLLPEGAFTRVDTLSGGWKKRVALARELARDPDVLLLDEPTNHLDVDSVLWLEDFLAQARFATLTITHDRLFLQRVAQRIIELDRRHVGGLLSVEGDYARYLETREAILSKQASREQSLRNTLRRETEWLRRGAKARTTKQKARIERAEALGTEVAELAFHNLERKARLEFQAAERQPKKLLEAREVSKAFGGRVLFQGLNLILGPGTRLGLIGANGCGKSTLIRCLLGDEAVDSGEIRRSDTLQVAYFRQNRESLDPDQTLVRTLAPGGEFVGYRGQRLHVRSYLDRFLFRSEQMEMPVGRLSGGEQARVLLAQLMLEPANLLVLDEPTNDLDRDTLEVLRQCLSDFPGAVLLVSHDRLFLEEVCPKIVAFPPMGSLHSARLVTFEGIDQWEEWYLDEKTSLQRKSREGEKQGAPTSSPQKPRKLSHKEQRELDSMEETLLAAEAKVETLLRETLLPENAARPDRLRELARDLEGAQREVERLYARWEALTDKSASQP